AAHRPNAAPAMRVPILTVTSGAPMGRPNSCKPSYLGAMSGEPRSYLGARRSGLFVARVRALRNLRAKAERIGSRYPQTAIHEARRRAAAVARRCGRDRGTDRDWHFRPGTRWFACHCRAGDRQGTARLGDLDGVGIGYRPGAAEPEPRV